MFRLLSREIETMYVGLKRRIFWSYILNLAHVCVMPWASDVVSKCATLHCHSFVGMTASLVNTKPPQYLVTS